MSDRHEFYLDRDNDFRVILYKDGAVFVLTGVTKVALQFKGTLYDSDTYSDAFDWSTGTAGEIAFYLGKIAGIDSGRDKKAELILFDATVTNGLVWGTMDITGKEVE